MNESVRVSVTQQKVSAGDRKNGRSKTAGGAKFFCASAFTSPDRVLPVQFASAVDGLERSLNQKIWLLVQSGCSQGFEQLDDRIIDVLLDAKHIIPGKQPPCILLDSPGGYAKSAYQIARALNVKYGTFSVIIPRRAKSAATLLALGADRIFLSQQGELGPLDAQVFEPDREGFISALDEVQALERLSAFSLEVVDRTMMLMIDRTGKKVETLLPLILRYAADLTQPLMAKIDTVHYTQMSRSLKIAEEYAVRLLKRKYPDDLAKEIARHLVNNYADHTFAIDAADAGSFRLKVESPTAEQESLLDVVRPYLKQITAIGCLKEVQ